MGYRYNSPEFDTLEQLQQWAVDHGLEDEPGDPTSPGDIGITFGLAPPDVQTGIMVNFPRAEWNNAARVSRCESEWFSGAHNTDGEDSRGVFQINVEEAANPMYADWDLFDIATNCLAAGQIFKAWKTARGNGWGAWSCATKLGIVSSG